MAKATKTAANVVKAAYAKFDAIKKRVRDFDERTSPTEKANVAREILGILPTIREHNGDDAKGVRRVLRSLGHRISDDGYEVKFARPAKRAAKRVKRERANAEANVVTDDTPTSADDTTNAN